MSFSRIKYVAYFGLSKFAALLCVVLTALHPILHGTPLDPMVETCLPYLQGWALTQQ